MTEDNRTFQEEMARAIVRDVLAVVVDHIKVGDVPDHWNGFEIRAWFAKMFEHEVDATLMRDRRSKRRREFEQVYYERSLDTAARHKGG